MNLTLYINDEPLGAIESFELRRTHASEGATETWLAMLTLGAPTPGQAEDALAATRQRVGETGTVALKAGDTVIRTLTGCRTGPRLTGVKAVAPMPEAAHGPRRVQLTIEAVLQDAMQAVQSHVFTLRVMKAPGAPERLITKGRVVLRAGESPAAHESVIAATMTGFRRVRSAITRDAAEPALDYEVEDEQVFAPLPAGVEDGHVTRTLQTLPDGRRVQITAGFFSGPGAMARALELQGTGESRVTESPFARRVDFDFSETLAGGGELTRTEQIAYATMRRVVDHVLLSPGLPAYRQQVGAPFTEVTQHGHAAGEAAHPTPPAPVLPADVIERRVEYSVPEASAAPEQRYVTRWRYVMRARTEVAPLT